MFEKKDNGLFNYDFEETVLMLAKHGKLKKFLQIIHEKATKLMKKEEIRNLPETTKDEIRDIRDVSKMTHKD